ncbi:MAG: hypothetical protein A2X35_00845 [Elusimicrobia bacterium GWA2_61_42]|nr:MAG: hypothetical protein A2X35_00845 [Elusimicrobia bacterium GWA2_61_42]OGR75237.1 MAG: hypothetical protein A2X38_04940 [Elusimicrobia bacterium GWC2_61_25]
MSDNDFEAKVRGRNMKFPAVDGLMEIEVRTIIGQVEDKIAAIEEKLKIADTSKIAILAAYDFAVELYNLKQKSETNLEADSKKIDEVVARLERSLEKEE